MLKILKDIYYTSTDIWELARFKYAFPTKETEEGIFRDFTVSELEESVKATPVQHAVFVQCQNNNPDEASMSLP